jgi:oligopeptide transport system permease protein
MAILGGGVVLMMLVLCVGSLPWTGGRSDDGGPRRYEATDADRRLLPPYWAPAAADEQELRDAWAAVHGRSPRTVFGTDRLGRDLAVRCLAGGGVSLGIGIAAALIAVVIGTVYGTLAGAIGGRVDAVLMRIVDVLYGLPYILLVVLLAVAADGAVERLDARVFAARQAGDASAAPASLAFLQQHPSLVNVLTLLVAIGGVSWLTMARVIRGQVLSLRQRPFMESCRAIGVPLPRQFVRHLLPNLIGPIVVYATLAVPQAILSESFLSFLGIGVREPLPSWGNLAAAGLNELNTVRIRWWLLLWPCVLIAVTLLAMNFLGEAVREAFDPRRRL